MLSENWAIVKDWNESTRYDLRQDEEASRAALDFISAVIDQEHGVLTWIKAHW